MKDIARDLGVSVITVSKVIRNHSDIGQETRRKVLQRIKELNYQPNLAARALVTGKSFTAALIVPGLVNPFFADLATGLTNALRRKNYSLMISSSEESPDLERQEIDRFLSRRVDAIMIATMQLAIDSFHKIEAQKTPYVLLDRSLAGLRADFVGVDDVAVGRMATEHLIAVGCRRIAHVRGPATSTSIGRAEGYQQALAHHGLSPLNGYVVTGRSYEVEAWKSGFDAMENLLSLDPRPDGVFYYNDGTAIGGLDAILRAGLRVPEDIAVIGCGNLLYDKSLRVPLSSVDQHSAEIGEQAGNLSIALIEAKTRPDPANILLAPTLVARESTRRNP